MAIINLPSTFDDLYTFTAKTDSEQSVSDALILSIKNKGKLDLDYMESISGKSKDEIIDIFIENDVAYQNPEGWDGDDYSNWELKHEYLSGNLAVKRQRVLETIGAYSADHILSINISSNDKVKHRHFGEGTVIGFNTSKNTIELYFEDYGFKFFPYPGAFIEKHLIPENSIPNRFDRNLAAIDAVVPKFIGINDISVHIGSAWLSTDIIDDFIECLCGKSYRYSQLPEKYKTIHDSISGSWKVPYKSSRYDSRNIPVHKEYGTKSINALEIIEDLLNNKSIVVKCFNYITKKTITDESATIEAKEKAKLIEDRFSEFIHSTPRLEYKIEQLYHSYFGSTIRREYSGKILDFPGMNPKVTLYDYQRNAVARCIMAPNTLLAHDVGSGKSYIMIAAAKEMRRMGISKRNLFVVPNNLVGQWADFFSYLYPDSKVMVVGPNAFTTSKKNKTLAEMRDGDYDAIIIAYSCFDRLNLSTDTAYEQANAELNRINEAIEKNKPQVIPELTILKKRIQKKINQLITEKQNPETVYFDDLKINTLFIDEIHNYKNISINSYYNGINKKGGTKNDRMLDKIHYVQRTNSGRGIIAASGTPVTNSIADLYSLQVMLQSGELELSGIRSFNDWIGTFARREDSFEIDVDTSKYRESSRYHFHNVPELALMLSSIADFHTVTEDNLPSFDGYEEIVIPKTDKMNTFNHMLSRRVDYVHKGFVDKKDDNLLKITIDSMKGCLDLRLVLPYAAFSEKSKVAYCAKNIDKIYHEHSADKLTQLVFCDISTPKAGFNIYDELKRILIWYGIPSEEIAFIHDATTDSSRRKLFEQTRKGIIRVLIGSTKKLGTGTNVQDKLVAIHHLDVPWTPADMNQREGRILRSGNTCEKVHIFRYVTKDSFDAYSYQLLQQKQTFISEILQGCAEERECRDVDMMLTYAEIKSICIGNENLKKRFEAANELARYRILKRKSDEEHFSIRQELEKLETEIPEWTRKVSSLKKDSSLAEKQKFESEKNLRIKVNRIISNSLTAGDYNAEKTIYYRYHGFDIVRPTSVDKDNPCLFIKRERTYKVDLKPSNDDSVVDPASRINNAIRRIPTIYSNSCETLETLKVRREQCVEILGGECDYDEQIKYYSDLVESYDKELKNEERNF